MDLSVEHQLPDMLMLSLLCTLAGSTSLALSSDCCGVEQSLNALADPSKQSAKMLRRGVGVGAVKKREQTQVSRRDRDRWRETA
jgi:hypothetical protein